MLRKIQSFVENIKRTQYSNIKNILKDIPNYTKSSNGRPMKFPYTFTAKIAQFPIGFYMKHNWIWRYYPYGILASLPIFTYIHIKANSESNKKAWEEIRRKEQQEQEAHS